MFLITASRTCSRCFLCFFSCFFRSSFLAWSVGFMYLPPLVDAVFRLLPILALKSHGKFGMWGYKTLESSLFERYLRLCRGLKIRIFVPDFEIKARILRIQSDKNFSTFFNSYFDLFMNTRENLDFPDNWHFYWLTVVPKGVNYRDTTVVANISRNHSSFCNLGQKLGKSSISRLSPKSIKLQDKKRAEKLCSFHEAVISKMAYFITNFRHLTMNKKFKPKDTQNYLLIVSQVWKISQNSTTFSNLSKQNFQTQYHPVFSLFISSG